MKKYLTTLVLALAAITLTAQNDAGMKAQDASILESGIDSVPPRAFFDTGHVILAYVMCLTHSNTPRLFDPQMPAFWVGSMTLRDGIMGHKADGVPTKKGFLRQNEAGVTLLQLSKGLSRDIFGATTALQVGMGTIGLDRNYEATREDGKIQFVEAEEKLSSSSIKYLTLKVPVLLGVQDRRHRFSLLSGVSLDLCMRWAAASGSPGENCLTRKTRSGPFNVNCRELILPSARWFPMSSAILCLFERFANYAKNPASR